MASNIYAISTMKMPTTSLVHPRTASYLGNWSTARDLTSAIVGCLCLPQILIHATIINHTKALCADPLSIYQLITILNRSL